MGNSQRKGGRKTTVQPAFIPSAAFAAVPRTPPPPIPVATNLGSSGEVILNASLVGMQMPDSVPTEDGGFSDPESSLFDYQAMEEPGYSSVEMMSVSKKRQTMSEREPAQTPPQLRREIEQQQAAGRFYHVLEPEITVEDASALYATPNKDGRQRLPSHSLQGTAHDVRQAMQKVHDMPSDEEMHESMVQRSSAEQPPSARSIHYPPEHETGVKAVSKRKSRKKDGSMERSEVEMEAIVVPAASHRVEPQIPVIEDETAVSRDRSLSARSVERIHDLEAEKEHLQTLTSQLEQEVQSYREVVSTYEGGDTDSAASLLSKKQLDDLKKENDTLKSSVERLSIELSAYQAKYRPVNADNLLNIRYLNPLFLAYDDRLKERDENIKKYQMEMEALRIRTEDIVKENERLHLRLETSGPKGPVDITEWEQLKENARLVLEENQNLLEQINVKDQKAQDLNQAHIWEVSKLSKQLVLAESERKETEKELEECRQKYRELRQKHDSELLEHQDKITLEDHLNQMAELKRTMGDKEESHKQELDAVNSKLHAVQMERKATAAQIVDLTAENRKLNAEIKYLNKACRRAQQKMMLLQRAIQQSENKENTVQEYLGSVIKVAEKNAFERDTYAKVAKEQEIETRKAMNKLLHGNVTVGKLEEKLKLYKMKAAARISTVADRLKDQDEVFNLQKKEYEREIQHLRLLLKEKEILVQEVVKNKAETEEELEIMWQAANSENERIRDTMRKSIRKLREHSGLSDVLDKHEKVATLYVSSDEEAAS